MALRPDRVFWTAFVDNDILTVNVDVSSAGLPDKFKTSGTELAMATVSGGLTRGKQLVARPTGHRVPVGEVGRTSSLPIYGRPGTTHRLLPAQLICMSPNLELGRLSPQPRRSSYIIFLGGNKTPGEL